MDEQERSATMSRIETKKSKEKKSYLSALPASSEELLEGRMHSQYACSVLYLSLSLSLSLGSFASICIKWRAWFYGVI